MTQPITISHLRFDNILGAGCQVKAYIDQEVPCVEFTMKGNHHQTVMVKCSEPILTASEPFVQFSSPEWDEMISKLFREMVDAWNEKHGTKIEEVGSQEE